MGYLGEAQLLAAGRRSALLSCASQNIHLRKKATQGSFFRLRIDRLATLVHLDEGLDFPPGLGLHVVDPEGQCEAVLLW
jgi:hypothetical protein